MSAHRKRSGKSFRSGYLRLVVLSISLFGFAACGDDVSNDPGRTVDGCFECAANEYCIILKAAAGDSFSCATPTCEGDCACFIKDGKERLAACENYSCQEGTGILYCRE